MTTAETETLLYLISYKKKTQFHFERKIHQLQLVLQVSFMLLVKINKQISKIFFEKETINFWTMFWVLLIQKFWDFWSGIVYTHIYESSNYVIIGKTCFLSFWKWTLNLKSHMTSHPKYQNIKKLKWKIQVNKNYGKK